MKTLIGLIGVVAVTIVLSVTILLGQTSPPSQQPTFRVQINAVTIDVVARDERGQFVPDLAKDEFEIYEDGVKQTLTSMTMSLGGRVTNVIEAPAPPAPEGVILPARRAAVETPGRIFLFFVDDLHLQVENTPRLRALFAQMARTLLHQGDLFAVLSSGPSSIDVSYTYDLGRMSQAINHIVGHGLPPNEIIQSGQSVHGVSELRYRAQVAFNTMHGALQDLSRLQNRRKALVWVSEGYDFTPFQQSRLGQGDPNNFFQQNFRNFQRTNNVNDDGTHQQIIDPLVEAQKQHELFSDADLNAAVRQLTDEANRFNTTIYTIDPRGLVAGQQIDQQVNPTEWNEYVVKEQETMRDIAENTGGLAVVEDNDFDRALKRIDADASDYYILGYSSSTADHPASRHHIEVRVTRKGTSVRSRSELLVPKPARGVPAVTASPVTAAPPETARSPKQEEPGRSVNERVYTAAQAQNGADLFRQHCSACHEPSRFTGQSFVDNWEGPLDTLFNTVRTTMPENNPGGLSPKAYADVIAYWLSLNGYPAGTNDLVGTASAMHNVQLERKP